MRTMSRLTQLLVLPVCLFYSLPATAQAQAPLPDARCPSRPFDQVQAEFKSPPAARGEALIDRAVFWQKMEKLVAAKEVFRFVNSKGEKKEVILHRSVLAGAPRAAIESIFDHWEGSPTHPKHLALMLGTAYRETCGFVSSGVGEACGCKRTCRAVEFKNSRYGKKDSCGRAYFGRGFVQITGLKNYTQIGEMLGIPLKDYPDLAYDQDLAIKLLVEGVQNRWFSGEKITHYLNDERSDWVNARDSINPGSSNKVATGYLSCRFYDALQAAYKQAAPEQDPALCMRLKNSPPLKRSNRRDAKKI